MPYLLNSLAALVLLTGMPNVPVAQASRFEGSHEQLREVAGEVWQSYSILVRPSGLPVDTAEREADGSWKLSGFTSPSNIAAYLWSILAARGLDLIDEDEAGRRLDQTLGAVERLERAHGFFLNWYDPDTGHRLESWPTTGAPVRPFLSSVDNGWLAMTLMMIRNVRPELRERAESLLGPMDFAFFYDAYDPADPIAGPGLLHIGYRIDEGRFTGSHYGLLNSEARIASYVGIARGQLPPEHYYRMYRTLPPLGSVQGQVPGGEAREYLGVSVFQGHYTYRDMRIVPSWGGSMFEALMVPLFVPEATWGRESWGINHPLYVRAQIEFGRHEAGHGFWGFSPSSRPGGGYAEYGIPPIATLPGGYSGRGAESEGHVVTCVVTPHAVFLALPFAQDEALDNLRALSERFEVQGQHGFYDSVDVESGRVFQGFLALDQGMILASIANVLADDLMQRQFSEGPVEAVLRPLLEPERFTAGPTQIAHATPLAPAEPTAVAVGETPAEP